MTKTQITYISDITEYLNTIAIANGLETRVTQHEVSRCFQDSYVLSQGLEEILNLLGDEVMVGYINTYPGMSARYKEYAAKIYLERRRVDHSTNWLRPHTLTIVGVVVIATLVSVGYLAPIIYAAITGVLSD